jgi:hypothetical protein
MSNTDFLEFSVEQMQKSRSWLNLISETKEENRENLYVQNPRFSFLNSWTVPINAVKWNFLFYQEQTSIYRNIENVMKEIPSGIVISNHADIFNYLLQHQDMLVLLPVVSIITANRFQNIANLYLEVFHDFEADDSYLAIYVRQQEYKDDIIDQINEVCSKYQDLLIRKSGWIQVTTDFQ